MNHDDFIYRLREFAGALFLGSLSGIAVIFLYFGDFSTGWRCLLSILASGVAAGLLAALLFFFLDEPPVPLFIAVLAASAAAGGTVFWILYRPAVPFFWFTLGTPPALFLLMLFEHLISIAYMRIRRGPA